MKTQIVFSVRCKCFLCWKDHFYCSKLFWKVAETYKCVTVGLLYITPCISSVFVKCRKPRFDLNCANFQCVTYIIHCSILRKKIAFQSFNDSLSIVEISELQIALLWRRQNKHWQLPDYKRGKGRNDPYHIHLLSAWLLRKALLTLYSCLQYYHLCIGVIFCEGKFKFLNDHKKGNIPL